MTEGVRKYLDCSTAHITEQDDDLLRSSPSGLIIHQLEYGYLVYVAPEGAAEVVDEQRDHARAIGLSESFIKVIDYARNQGCGWVKFDANAMYVPYLDTHNW